MAFNQISQNTNKFFLLLIFFLPFIIKSIFLRIIIVKNIVIDVFATTRGLFDNKNLQKLLINYSYFQPYNKNFFSAVYDKIKNIAL